MKDLLQILAASLLGLLAACLVYLKRRQGYWERAGVPFVEPSWLYGNVRDLFLMKRTECEVLDYFYRRLKGHKVSGLYYLWKPVLLVTDPEVLKSVLITDSSHFINHPPTTNMEGTDRIAWSLFFMRDDAWRNRRALFSSAFTPKRLKQIYEGVQANCEKILPLMKGLADRGEEAEMEAIVQRYAINVITASLFGLGTDTVENSNSVFLECGRAVSHPSLWTALKFMWYQQFPGFCRAIHMLTFPSSIWNFFHRFVKEVVQQREADNIVRDDLLGLMIKAKNEVINSSQEDGNNRFRMSLEEITGHTYAFFEAGYDTTALTTAYCIHELSEQRDVQERLRDEIDSVLGRFEGRLCYEAVQQMPYLEQVIAETLRKYPPAGVIKRECNREYTLPGTGVRVPVGMTLCVPVYSLHRDPEYYPQPERFMPERFKEGKPPSVYFPFGKGPRICAGMKLAEMEIKIALSVLLRNFEFLPSDRMKGIRFDPQSLFISTRPKGGLWAGIRHRSKPL